MTGFICIDKPENMTSFTAANLVKRITGSKKAGHTGTLDPMATGVLTVALSGATRFIELIPDHEKSYTARILLGVTTDTLDITGTVTGSFPVSVTPCEAEGAALSFYGEQLQIPPMYSALKVNGKKLYELAREGKTVERKARPVCFYEIEPLEFHLPLVKIRVTCSKGTYIRTLCHDIGEKLGCGGCMEELLRTRSGNFVWEDSMTLAEVEEAVKDGTIEDRVICIGQVLKDYPEIFCTREGDRLLENGNALTEYFVKGSHKEGWVRMCDSQGEFKGIYQWDEAKNRYQPQKMFL